MAKTRRKQAAGLGKIETTRALRRTLYMATLTGIRYNPVLKPHYEQLVKRCKEKKVAITACTPALAGGARVRKLLVILNAMLMNQQPFRYPAST